MFAHIHAASPDELKRWYTTLVASERPPIKAIRLIVARLAAIDPADALAFVDSNDEGGWYRPIVLEAWARVDFSAAFDAYLSLIDRHIHPPSFLGGLQEDQIEKAYGIMIGRGFDQEYPERFVPMFSLLARGNPQVAAEHILELTLLKKGGNYPYEFRN